MTTYYCYLWCPEYYINMAKGKTVNQLGTEKDLIQLGVTTLVIVAANLLILATIGVLSYFMPA